MTTAEIQTTYGKITSLLKEKRLKEALDEIYPVQISVYFEEYAKILKGKIRYYFKTLSP